MGCVIMQIEFYNANKVHSTNRNLSKIDCSENEAK